MAIKEVDHELWNLAVENVTKRQEGAFDALFDQAVEKHLKTDCAGCEDGLCSGCEERIASGIENLQERQFDEQAETEYDRLLEQQEAQETE